ncbi:Rv3235 family protein [Rhodococcus daqingensis]|uniref:Rv3235 family protein n=1 Tax=Rhodococcus daqingensis TaxID=2479363 RepID=A0ABW2RUN2_9NOCA
MREPSRFLTQAPPCEPPVAGRSESRATAHRAPTRSPHSGRSPLRNHGPARPPAEALTVDPEARRSAEHALRVTLEVLDRRRPPAQLRPLLAPSLAGLVGTLSRQPVPARRLGVACLQRVHLRASDADTVEVFGSYSRGQRMFAVAARLERTPAAGIAPPGHSAGSAPPPGGWRVTSLQIG